MHELLLTIQPGATEPLYRQVYRGVRDAILSRTLPAGAQLPSTRELARSLEVSRTTILVAFNQLVAEGYIVGEVGSGSFVASQIPDHLLLVGDRVAGLPIVNGGGARFSQRGQQLRSIPRRRHDTYPGAFWTGVPPLDEFPLRIWARLASRRYRNLTDTQLYHGSPAGYLPLREAIAIHLATSRGVRCEAGQIIILSSAQEAMDIACRSLLDPGDPAWIEDPGWGGARGALIGAGARVVPVPVDRHGLDVEEGIRTEPRARLAYVSPSHQYPMGVTMSLERRLALLQWAARSDAWILEDDYDSEYRYAGRPLTALQGLDSAQRVLYIGTFNKTVFPALRIAYLVAPPSLVEGLLRVRSIGGQHVPTAEQAILTDFITEGHFIRHLRRMRTIGGERRDALIAAAARELPGVLEVVSVETGLHTVAFLPDGMDDSTASDAVAAEGIEAAPLSACYHGPCPRGGLILGYAGLAPDRIRLAMRRLATGLRTVLPETEPAGRPGVPV